MRDWAGSQAGEEFEILAHGVVRDWHRVYNLCKHPQPTKRVDMEKIQRRWTLIKSYIGWEDFIAISLILVGVLGYFQGPIAYVAHLTDFYIDIRSELIGIGITVLIIDNVIEMYRRRAEKERLILQMGSPDNGFAIEAVRQLRQRGWLYDGSLKWANLGNANLKGVYLSEASLQEANLDGANLILANLEKANLQRAKMRGARLIRASLIEANLFLANLQEANLKDADLEKANLRGAKLRGAVLGSANLKGATMPDGKIYDPAIHGPTKSSDQ